MWIVSPVSVDLFDRLVWMENGCYQSRQVSLTKTTMKTCHQRQSDVTATEFDDVYVKKNTHPSGKLCETSTFIWCANKRTWTDENGRQSNFLCWKLNCHWKCLEFISGKEVTNPGCRTLFPQDLVRKHVSWSRDVLGSLALLRFVEVNGNSNSKKNT